jgi:hypothetical protein
MAIYIPETMPRPWLRNIPFPPEVLPVEQYNPDFEKGEAINAPPFEGEMFLSFTTPVGKVSGVFYSLVFQLRRWGFIRYKIDESIFVSPVFKQYYDITIEQKERLSAAIKSGLASIGQAIADFELVWHDLRKYKEFLDYFSKLEKGKKMKGEEGEKLMAEGNQTLKSLFIDQVDVHTGEGVALKLIAPRWPTIIVDFMRLKDEDTDFKKIAKDYQISEAEGVVLATKNKLFLEWRDRMFKPTVMERYQTLKGLLEARRKSIDEYRTMLKPTITRYKMINDSLESPKGRFGITTAAAVRADAQAVSRDEVIMWAWRPFAPAEKYKVSRESMDFINASQAGFNEREIKELQKEKLLGKDRVVFGLPLEPSIDRAVRFYFKNWGPDEKNPTLGALENYYHVNLTAADLFHARQMLVDQFRHSFTGLSAIEPWTWSPYFVFLTIPWNRSVFRTPDGSEAEDLELEHFQSATYSQNLIIVRCLELIAKEKQLENYINSLLAEYGVNPQALANIQDYITKEELSMQEYPEIFGESKKKKSEEELKGLEKKYLPALKMAELSRKIRKGVGGTLEKVGLGGQIFRAIGPYEFTMQNTMAKIMQREPGGQFNKIKDFLKTKFGVPGVNVTW